jgi:hypothetical protein
VRVWSSPHDLLKKLPKRELEGAVAPAAGSAAAEAEAVAVAELELLLPAVATVGTAASLEVSGPVTTV